MKLSVVTKTKYFLVKVDKKREGRLSVLVVLGLEPRKATLTNFFHATYKIKRQQTYVKLYKFSHAACKVFHALFPILHTIKIGST